jgi:cobalt-zinc-cadmium efflux system protein
MHCNFVYSHLKYYLYTMAHTHHIHDGLGRTFAIGIGLNVAFVAAEFAAGIVLDSVALLSDAGHNLGDVAGMAVSLLAFRLAARPATPVYTYGLRRGTILAALANACLLLVAVGMILVESIGKLRAPHPVDGGVVAWVAGAGIAVNALTAWLFMRRGDGELNSRSAFLHMAADALVSLGVVVSGIVIGRTGWYVVDPLVGIAVAVVIFVSTWHLLRESVRLSLDGVPAGIDPDAIADVIGSTDNGITGVEHIHIWALSTSENALTAHVAVGPTVDHEGLRRRIKERLRENGIAHATLEIENQAITGTSTHSQSGCSAARWPRR